MHFILSATVSVLGLLASSVSALPAKKAQTYTPASNLDRLAKLMPKSALPAPDGLQLKYVVLGVGTQNYTCATGDESAAPGTTGATGTFSSTCIDSSRDTDVHSQPIRHRYPPQQRPLRQMDYPLYLALGPLAVIPARALHPEPAVSRLRASSRTPLLQRRISRVRSRPTLHLPVSSHRPGQAERNRCAELFLPWYQR